MRSGLNIFGVLTELNTGASSGPGPVSIILRIELNGSIGTGSSVNSGGGTELEMHHEASTRHWSEWSSSGAGTEGPDEVDFSSLTWELLGRRFDDLGGSQGHGEWSSRNTDLIEDPVGVHDWSSVSGGVHSRLHSNWSELTDSGGSGTGELKTISGHRGKSTGEGTRGDVVGEATGTGVLDGGWSVPGVSKGPSGSRASWSEASGGWDSDHQVTGGRERIVEAEVKRKLRVSSSLWTVPSGLSYTVDTT